MPDPTHIQITTTKRIVNRPVIHPGLYALDDPLVSDKLAHLVQHGYGHYRVVDDAPVSDPVQEDVTDTAPADAEVETDDASMSDDAPTPKARSRKARKSS